MNYLRLYIFTMLLASITWNISLGQDEPPLRGKAAERIEQFKKIRLMEAIQMNEETSIRFMSRYNKHIESMRDIVKERNDLIDELQKLVRSKASDSELEKVIKGIDVNEHTIAEERSKFILGLKDILTMKQIAEYAVFERNFNRNLRDMIKDMARDRWNSRRE